MFIILFLFIASSCSSLRSGAPVKAGYEAEQGGWAERNIPGVKSLSNLLPPATDARKQWDSYQKRKNERWSTDSSGPQFP